MNAPRDPDDLIRAFLGEGETTLPDRAFDIVRGDIHRTRQRVVIGPWREPDMSILTRVAIAAAAVVAVGLAWVNFGPPSQSGTGAQPTALPTPTAASTEAASPLSAATLTPGATYRIASPGTVGSHPLTFTVPGSDWFAIDPTGILGKDVLPPTQNYDIAFSTWLVGNVYTDFCHWGGNEVTPPVGPTADELAVALAAQAGRSGSTPTDVTVGGYAGKRVDLSVAADFDENECTSHVAHPWIGVDRSSGGWIYGPGQKNSVYILDVAGERLVLDTMYLPGTTEANLAELQQLIESIRFEP